VHEQQSRPELVTPLSSWSVPRDLDPNHAQIEFEAENRERRKLWEAIRLRLRRLNEHGLPTSRIMIRNDMLDDRQGLRAWLIGAALIMVFCLGWIGGSNSDRVLSVGADANSGRQSLSPEMQSISANAKPASVNSTGAVPETPKPRKIPASNASPAEQARMPSGDPPRAGAPNPIASLPQESAAALGPAGPRTPVPETRPATIAGWTVRDVQGGRATLEGPGGVWRAATGDTVPEVGQIHSIVRWGGHWVVATSRGLIATR
jgi:hypothetical protein